jgi:hypothetical protein
MGPAGPGGWAGGRAGQVRVEPMGSTQVEKERFFFLFSEIISSENNYCEV